ncbi:hypothetical protein EON80_31540 [bacterium]|nr:MAG: hypothetical protein EON80_31540 [bacterium]
MKIPFLAEIRTVAIAFASLVLVTSVGVMWYRHQGHRNAWQLEAERHFKRDFPSHMPEPQFIQVAKTKGYFVRRPKPAVASVHLWAHKMKNSPGFPSDSVAMDIYFDESRNIKGYGKPYEWRID